MIPTALGPTVLEKLASLLERGRIQLPVLPGDLQRLVPCAHAAEAASALSALATGGFSPPQAALVLHQSAAERRALQAVRDHAELVWSGPERAASASRDTGAVVRELFRGAKHAPKRIIGAVAAGAI